MATKKIGRIGFAQVEPNHLSGIVAGQIYAQLPVDKTAMGEVIENGRFAKYDYAEGKVNLAGAGEWMLIYNEEKKYDERKQGHKDFAMVSKNYTDGEIVPRLIKTNVGDIFTTNAFGANDADDAEVEEAITITIDDVTGVCSTVLGVNKDTGYLDVKGASTDANGPEFEVAKVYTMADGQDGLKLVRIK